MQFPPQRILYIPNGVETSRFKILTNPNNIRKSLGLKSSEPVLLYVGEHNLVNHPVDLLLYAFQIILREVPNVYLILVGSGIDQGYLQDLAHELQVSNRTIFVGRIPPKDVPQYYAIATVSVDPVHDDIVGKSRYPLKIVESLYMGVPVITGDVGDRRSILQIDKLGLLVSPGDSQAIAKGVLDLLGDPDLRQQMSIYALASRHQWTWKALAPLFLGVYGKKNTSKQ